MAISKTSLTLILSSILVLAMACPLKAQDSPQDYVDEHNKARADVHVGRVSWNYTVAADAKKDAEAGSASCYFFSYYYGANLMSSSGDLSGAEAVKSWVDTKDDYDYKSNTCLNQQEMKCTNYTQVVWRNTVGIGCAKVKCFNGLNVVLCYYYPRGNIFGQKPY